MDPIHEAEQAKWFGPAFVSKARSICSGLDIPVEWFLAAMSWETGHYSAYKGDGVFGNGIHWAENPDPNDAGGGLFGWRHIRDRKDLNWKNPVQQLDDAAQYLRDRMKELKISSFERPDDFYVLVRGPYALTQPHNDNYPMGAGLSQGEARKIYWKQKLTKEYGWTATDYPGIDNTNDTYSLSWVPTKSVAKTKSASVPVRSGPATTYRVTRMLVVLGTSVSCLGKVTGDGVNGNTDWVMVGTNEYISGTQLSFD
jgi:hypothetical protein